MCTCANGPLVLFFFDMQYGTLEFLLLLSIAAFSVAHNNYVREFSDVAQAGFALSERTAAPDPAFPSGVDPNTPELSYSWLLIIMQQFGLRYGRAAQTAQLPVVMVARLLK